MEYSQTKYFLFEINEYLNSYNFMIIFFITMFLLSTLFFIYSYFNSEQFFFKRMKKNKTFNVICFFSVVLIYFVMFITITGRNYSVDSPNEIIKSNNENIVAKGKIVSGDDNGDNVNVEFYYNGRMYNQPVATFPHEIDLSKKDFQMFEMLYIKPESKKLIGSEINIVFKPYKYKYTNRKHFKVKSYNDKLKQINSNMVNSEVKIVK
ncbi:hypothetical protein R4B61_02885 [Fructilactobacillus vespulae]|uniref:hypothetical protein n=1 Tax=Fructilactobacillus vespulae TaxID=1249630 RepID=UPI0039B3F392